MKISKDLVEPPIRSYFMRSLALMWRFVLIISTRMLDYAVMTGDYSVSRVQSIIIGFNRTKKFFIRMLTFRGGYFYQTPRLGIVTMLSTTVSFMVIMPLVQPVDQSYALAQVLENAEADAIIEEDMLTVTSVQTVEMAVEITAEEMRKDVVDHVVAGGETLSQIAEDYLVSSAAIEYVNDLGPNDFIHPGDTLKIPPVGGLIHKVDEDETVSTIATLYGVPAQAIVDFNHIEEPYIIHSEDELVIPDANVPDRTPVQTTLAAATTTHSHSHQTSGLVLESINTGVVGTGGFIMPTNATLTQYFWWGHTAIDLANSCGTPIIAADSGTVTFAGWWPGGGGNSIFINHGNGYTSKYAHMSSFAVTGGSVNRGDVIGYMGNTGRSYGCHLHFIVEYGGAAINPLSVL